MVVTESELADSSRSLLAEHSAPGTSSSSSEDTHNFDSASTNRATSCPKTSVHTLDEEMFAACNLDHQGLCLTGIEPVDTPPSLESDLSPTFSFVTERTPEYSHQDNRRIRSDDFPTETDAPSCPIQISHSVTDSGVECTAGQKFAPFCGCAEDPENQACWKTDDGMDNSLEWLGANTGKTRLSVSSTGDAFRPQEFPMGIPSAEPFVCRLPPEEPDNSSGKKQVAMPDLCGIEECKAVSSEDESIVVISSDMDSGDDAFEELFVDREENRDSFDGITGDEDYGVISRTESQDPSAVSEGESVDPEYLDEENAGSDARTYSLHLPLSSPQHSPDDLRPLSNLGCGKRILDFERRPLLPHPPDTVPSSEGGLSSPVSRCPVGPVMPPSDNYAEALSIWFFPTEFDSLFPGAKDPQKTVESQVEPALGSLFMRTSCVLTTQPKESSRTMMQFTSEESPVCQTAGELFENETEQTAEPRADPGACFERLPSPCSPHAGNEKERDPGCLSEQYSFSSEVPEVCMCSSDAPSSLFEAAICDEMTALLAGASRQTSSCHASLPDSPLQPLSLTDGKVIRESKQAQSFDNTEIVCGYSPRYSALPTNAQEDETCQARLSNEGIAELTEVGPGHGNLPVKREGRQGKGQRRTEASSGLIDCSSCTQPSFISAEKQSKNADDGTSFHSGQWKTSEGVGHGEAVAEREELELGAEGEETVNVAEEENDIPQDGECFYMPAGEGREQPSYREEEPTSGDYPQQREAEEEEIVPDKEHIGSAEEQQGGRVFVDDEGAGLREGEKLHCHNPMKGVKETRRGRKRNSKQCGKKKRYQRGAEQREQSFRTCETEEVLEDDLADQAGARHGNGVSEAAHRTADGQQNSSRPGCHSQQETECAEESKNAEEGGSDSFIDEDRHAGSPDGRQLQPEFLQGHDEEKSSSSSERKQRAREAMLLTIGQVQSREKHTRRLAHTALRTPVASNRRTQSPQSMATDTESKSNVQRDVREVSVPSLSPHFRGVGQTDDEGQMWTDNETNVPDRDPEGFRETRKACAFVGSESAYTSPRASSLVPDEGSIGHLISQRPSLAAQDNPRKCSISDAVNRKRFQDVMTVPCSSGRQKSRKKRGTAERGHTTKCAEAKQSDDTKDVTIAEQRQEGRGRTENNTFWREDAGGEKEPWKTSGEEQGQKASYIHLDCAEQHMEGQLDEQEEEERTTLRCVCSEEVGVEKKNCLDLDSSKGEAAGNERTRCWARWPEDEEEDDNIWREKEEMEEEHKTEKATNESVDRVFVHPTSERVKDTGGPHGAGVTHQRASGPLLVLAQQKGAPPAHEGRETAVRGRQDERAETDNREEWQRLLPLSSHRSADGNSFSSLAKGIMRSDERWSGTKTLFRKSVTGDGNRTRDAEKRTFFHSMETDPRSASAPPGRPCTYSGGNGIYSPERTADSRFAEDSPRERFKVDVELNQDSKGLTYFAKSPRSPSGNENDINGSHDSASLSVTPQTATVPQLKTGTGKNRCHVITKQEKSQRRNEDGGETRKQGKREAMLKGEDAAGVNQCAAGAVVPAAALAFPEGAKRGKETNGHCINLSSSLSCSPLPCPSPSTHLGRDGVPGKAIEESRDGGEKETGEARHEKEEHRDKSTLETQQEKEETEVKVQETVVTAAAHDEAAGLSARKEEQEEDREEEINADPCLDEDVPLLSILLPKGGKRSGAQKAKRDGKGGKLSALLRGSRRKENARGKAKHSLTRVLSSGVEGTLQVHSESMLPKTEQEEPEREKGDDGEEGDNENTGYAEGRGETPPQDEKGGRLEGKHRYIAEVMPPPDIDAGEVDTKVRNLGDHEMESVNEREKEEPNREAERDVAHGSESTIEYAHETPVQHGSSADAKQECWGEAAKDSQNLNTTDLRKTGSVQALLGGEVEAKNAPMTTAVERSDFEAKALAMATMHQTRLAGEKADHGEKAEDRYRRKREDISGNDEDNKEKETETINMERDGAETTGEKTEGTETVGKVEHQTTRVHPEQEKRRRGQRRREQQEERRQRKRIQLQEERLKKEEEERKAKEMEGQRRQQGVCERLVEEAPLKKAEDHLGKQFQRDQQRTRTDQSLSEHQSSKSIRDALCNLEPVPAVSSLRRSSVPSSSLQTGFPSSVCGARPSSFGREQKNNCGKKRQTCCHRKSPHLSSPSSRFPRQPREGLRASGGETRGSLVAYGESRGRLHQLSKWTVWAVLLLAWTWWRPASVPN
ncbi:conserved hypothetical protein [Neospora caninum Liverpool]|uniref:Uncharacterized protein n=1 Tax=Neospora caninum (strain Liverpool) TaxID=572307 RepID=F0VDN5_NEOCL|nr:conserved hypothetical protein [Neospora caninum Liverpool]CBZ51828.1 conserved hypothetical protein [Neospora caninum Liverpool]CEL65786.1 TPA: hypothetical protein BN1204_016200 [Neospora caninum Liverpool]|eukprot:XP_003881861.1 conserved hypothetical protein [Neospora caninum Liverpool]